MTTKRKAMRYKIPMPCGCPRRTCIAPDSPVAAVYYAMVQARRCPTCGQVPMEDAR
ncbi:MAG: hypothetical protein ACYDCO_25565 [Armatimonadota bacterium]